MTMLTQEPASSLRGPTSPSIGPTTLAEFQAHVAAGEIHYYVARLIAAGFPGPNGWSDVAATIADWVADTFESQVIGGTTVFDLTH